MNFDFITILGPTAVGKTRLGCMLADEFGGEIISADSRQVYRGMDIGTGKDMHDYIVNGNQINYHLIDIIDPSEEFNLYDFKRLFHCVYGDITKRNKIPFLVGGTGLYIDAVLNNYNLSKVEFSDEKISQLRQYSIESLIRMLEELNPSLHNTTDLLIKERLIKAIIIAEQKNVPVYNQSTNLYSFVIGVKRDIDEIKKSITDRLKKRLDQGMIDEVKKLIGGGISLERLKIFGLEYKFVGQYLFNELNYNDMFQKLNSAIHAFAKRQMTWFRKMEREGIKIHWLEGPDFNSAKELIDKNFFNR